MPGVDEFRVQFPAPAFAGVADSAIQLAIDEAEFIHTVTDLGQLFCAAHILTLEQAAASRASLPGEINKEDAGPLKVSYMTQAERGRESFFTRTEYGRRFLIIEKRSARVGLGMLVR